jgi:cell division protein FtsB
MDEIRNRSEANIGEIIALHESLRELQNGSPNEILGRLPDDGPEWKAEKDRRAREFLAALTERGISLDSLEFHDQICASERDIDRLVERLAAEKRKVHELKEHIGGLVETRPDSEPSSRFAEIIREQARVEIAASNNELEERVLKVFLFLMIVLIVFGSFIGREEFFTAALFVGIVAAVFRIARTRWLN